MSLNEHPIYLDVVNSIMDLINSKKISVGAKLPSERDLAESLNVSRGSLREALRVLEQQKIIQSQKGSGKYVVNSQPQTDEPQDTLYQQMENAMILDLLEAREVLEDAIIEMVCLRATDEDMENIENVFENMLKWIESPKLDPLNHDNLFHLAIAQASHNSVFVSIYAANLKILEKIRNDNFQSPLRKKLTLEEHTNIYNAIKERDVLMARLAARIHLRNVRKNYMQLSENISTVQKPK